MPLRKITLRLIPFMFLLYILAYLDRINVSFAALRMQKDLGFSDAVYGFGAGLFFVGYFLFEVPSNLILEKVGARRWIARIMISWGLISSATMFTRGRLSFYFLRTLLGLAEAGFFPGMVLYLTYWYPARHRARAVAAFLTATAVAGVVGSPISGLLLKLDGVGHLAGWQWLFLLEGVPCIPVGVLVLFLLPDSPAHAKWLTPEERRWLSNELAAESHHAPHTLRTLSQSLADPRVWLLSLLYFLLVCGLYGFSLWVPKIIKTVSAAPDATVGLLTAIPYSAAAIAMVLIGRHSDQTGERRVHVAACAVGAAVGLAATPFCPTTPAALAALSLAASGIWGSLGPFWVLPTSFLHGTARAAGIATINSLGCLSGFAAPALIGYLRDKTQSFTPGLLALAATLLSAAVLVLLLPSSSDAEAFVGPAGTPREMPATFTAEATPRAKTIARGDDNL
jgi:ACS family tartrate transporter-like MFS transporter